MRVLSRGVSGLGPVATLRALGIRRPGLAWSRLKTKNSPSSQAVRGCLEFGLGSALISDSTHRNSVETLYLHSYLQKNPKAGQPHFSISICFERCLRQAWPPPNLFCFRFSQRTHRAHARHPFLKPEFPVHATATRLHALLDLQPFLIWVEGRCRPPGCIDQIMECPSIVRDVCKREAS